MTPLSLIFMGSPPVAVVILEALLKAGHDIRAVVTQPDKPAGRGQKLSPPPVKSFAQEKGLKILQPTKVKSPEFLEELRSYKPQGIIAAAYGKILSQEMINLAPLGILNVHFSLLPQYRGASCVASAILNDEKETGVTIMHIIEKLDAGPLLKQQKIKIEETDTTGILEEKLAHLGSKLLLETLDEMKEGKITPHPQDESKASFAPLIKKEMALIDWKQPTRKIFNQVRAYNPWPVAFTHVDKKRLKVYGAKLPLIPTLSPQGRGPGRERPRMRGRGEPGQIINLDNEGIEIACGDGKILLTEIQLEGKNKMSAKDFIQGHQELIQTGKKLG